MPDDVAETLPGGAPTLSVTDAMELVDWRSTPVGPRASWPALLDSIVRVVQASKFSMWLGWGPDLVFFYNDAYRRDTLGVKHPWALGRPAREVWEEIWGDIGPRLDHVLQGNTTWDEALLLFLERSGYREETYHTFSYSPITESDGSVAGVLCVVTEETDRVIGERRLATLRQLASELSRNRREDQVFEAVGSELARNPYDLPYALVYAFDSDGTPRLACAAGTEPGSPVAPVALGTGDSTWPVGQLLEVDRPVVIDDVLERFGEAPRGVWNVPTSTAVMVPLSQQGQVAPAGFLVAGANPYRQLDDDAIAFFELLAGQIAAGVANARAYEAERRRAEALADLDRAKTEFFSNVSHEFRTPLTLILGPAEDALSDDAEPLSAAQSARIEVIRRNARRLRRLVNDMLDFARVEGGRLRAETEPTDLAALTRDVALSFAPAIERAGLAFVVDCPPLGRPVHVDRDMWEKILLNLLSNALKFTLHGEIRIRLRGEADAAVLTVADTGAGIPEGDLPRLFERFYRGPRHQARSHEGTGIGLALVHQFVQLHDGTIEASSEEGHGAAFTVSIPFGTRGTATGPVQRDSTRQAYLDEALQWLAPTDAGEPTSAIRVGRTGGARVLVVDDNPDMRRHVARILEPFWEVSVATNGIDALEAVRRERPDLVLTDVMMPELDGFGLLDALRSDQQTATIPVVFLSARAGEDAAVEGLDAGADDYLVKPFSSLELLARVRSNLELAAMRNQESAWRTALVEALDEAVAVLDATGSVVEMNQGFERMLGFPRSGLPYQPPYPWLPPADETATTSAHSHAVFDRVLAEGRFEGTVEVRHRDGRPVHVSGVIDSVEIAGERRHVAAFRDVTAELLAAERESALAQVGIRLAEAGDVEEVVQAALSELQRIFRAAGAGIERSRGGADAVDPGNRAELVAPAAGPAPATPRPSDAVAPAVAATWQQRQVTMAPAPERLPGHEVVAGMAAPLDPATDAGVLWLEFQRPRPVTSDERSLFAVLSGYVGQALRRAQLFDDNRMVATAMQRSILGPTGTPDSIAVRYLPAVQPLEVGGDWYDVVELPGDRLGIVVGDCVGRGLPAATVMGQLRSACRALLLQAQSPAAAVSSLDAFADRIPGAQCTTVFCAILDRSTAELRLCSAGHVPGVLVHPEGWADLLHQPGSVPLAVLPGTLRTESIARLQPGSALVLCTDGLIERRGESLDVGLERLRQAATVWRDLEPHTLADRLMERLIPAGGQEDDVAMVVYRHQSVPPSLFSTSVAADSAELAGLRRRLEPWLRAHGVPPQRVTDFLIAAGEAVSNAMEHAYGFDPSRRVDVRARVAGTTLEMRVTDRGTWRPARGPNDERGRGLPIMRGLMDDVAVETDQDGTTVVLRSEVGGGS